MAPSTTATAPRPAPPGTDQPGVWAEIDGGATAHWWTGTVLTLRGTLCGRLARYEAKEAPRSNRCLDCLHLLQRPRDSREHAH